MEILFGNSICVLIKFAGKFIERKDKYFRVVYVTEGEAVKLIRRKTFVDMEHVKGGIYMVKLKPSTYVEDVPVALGSFILTKAKHVMLDFYFNFMDHYYDRRYWELCSMDTDSVRSACSY